MKITIIGCGYTGQILVPTLLQDGHELTVTTTSNQNHDALKKMGTVPYVLQHDDAIDSYQRCLEHAQGLIFLAPPDPKIDADAIADKISKSAKQLKVCVYGSTTGVYGQMQDQTQWIDESSPCGQRNPRSERRAKMEQALRQSGLNTKIVRIAGIYGPGRTLANRVRDPNWPLFEGAPATSRIHVEDLARILHAMLDPSAPELVNACDESPSTTLQVAQYTAKLLGVALPALVTAEEAKTRMSDMAWSFRSSGRRCRSIYRSKTLKQLTFPSYIEGVEASLKADGLI